MSLKSKDLYNIILDSSQLEKPELYTVRMIENNIYHPIGENEYLGFKLDENNNTLNSINSNGDICKFKNYFFSKWGLKNHIDIYITGSIQSLFKFDIVCGGSINQTIPFNLDCNESKNIKIKDTKFKLKRRTEKFMWENMTESNIEFEINKLKTNGFNYNILTVNSSKNINSINFLD